ncbi:hypothetical protein GHT09_016208 [Marmota monax]|uniref:G-protein coupled receptors family 1 profile domain-containing protein n=1 Tax=Marmota monax TaxID=9995 RepID=A0A834UWC0_MARMO|nr:hypothetical protein GHT09_016208 [Marmota monax]
MYSGNRSGSQGSWEGDGPAGAEGSAPEGTLSPTPLFSPGTYERLALLFGSLGLLGAGSNLLVLVLYYKFQRLRTPTHLFLVNISLGDLLMSLFGVTFTFVSCLRNRWVWDTVGCVWDGFSSSLFVHGVSATFPSLLHPRCRDFALVARLFPRTLTLNSGFILSCSFRLQPLHKVSGFRQAHLSSQVSVFTS